MTARRPARRGGRPRSRKRKQAYTGGEVLVGVFVIVWLVSVLLDWLAAHPWVLPVTLLAAGAGAFFWFRLRAQQGQWQSQVPGLRYPLELLDRLHHRQFEDAIRDLMLRDGCQDAVQVGGAGDNGADVKATDPFGRRWVIQCKHRRAGLAGAAVGTPDLHVLNGTGRPVHKGDVIVLVTNGRFTKPATDFAQSQRLHLVDRHTLATWAAGPRPLWELLRAVPPPRRPTTLS
ncbi:restriction endonuclease (plasmid) [Streptomyces clavifer]|uniref:restriction endonuclease n=1 Tax=Streptomyces clavifer TaxID=68188 RepID=UPI002E807808|nr:restriction endonuclease [Streptomyces clavifer]WUC32492.1 restriction endonuclease [Streptomyces clavifer]